MKHRIVYAAKPLAAALALLGAAGAHAQDVATERELTPVVVTGQGERVQLDPTLPTSTHSATRAELQTQSFTNTEDALTYAPNMAVRKRFVGDRNANLSGRSFGTLQPARGLAYVDGYLISNFLGRFDAPRWNIVSPEEVSRVDVLYGPFSAIYPGNSIGTTVAITTRMPEKFEGSARVQFHRQWHDHYGLKDHYDNNQQSVYLGNRWDALALAVSMNRLAYHSHPMSYATSSLSSTSAGSAPVVTGAVRDRSPEGADRIVLGATGIQKGIQENFKLKAAYDLSSELEVDAVLAVWRNDYRVSNRTLLRDSAGNEVWRPATGSLNVNIDGSRYAVPTMAPSKGKDEHYQWGTRLRTTHQTGWNHSVQLSAYDLHKDGSRQASVSDPFAAAAVPGSDSRRDGTGWTTFELQSTYTPEEPGHALTFGYHRNSYKLENRVYALSNWNDVSSRTAETENYLGKTEVQALYVQDAWTFDPEWVATFGVPLERFRAFDGSQMGRSGAVQERYAGRTASGVSPKLSLSHFASDDWLLRASFGRGVRFPTVSELFQGTVRPDTIVVNDPGLKPERSNAVELTAIRELGSSSLRVSLFQDDIRDTIFRQNQDIGGGVTVQTVQNVGRVRTRGIEFAYTGRDLLVPGFGLQASLALNRSKTLSNAADPSSEGKHFPRIPTVRASVLASYEHGAWTGSVGVRHSGTMYNSLDNSDVVSNTFGGQSRFTVADLKVLHRFDKHTALALGVDNVSDKRYYTYHPYPGRTAYTELQVSF